MPIVSLLWMLLRGLNIGNLMLNSMRPQKDPSGQRPRLSISTPSVVQPKALRHECVVVQTVDQKRFNCNERMACFEHVRRRDEVEAPTNKGTNESTNERTNAAKRRAVVARNSVDGH